MDRLPKLFFTLTFIAFCCGSLARASTGSASADPRVQAELLKQDLIERKFFDSWGDIRNGMNMDEIEAVIGPCFGDFRTAMDKVLARIRGTEFAVTMDFEYVVTNLSARNAGYNGFSESRFIYRVGNYTLAFDCDGKLVSHSRSSPDGSGVFMTGQ